MRSSWGGGLTVSTTDRWFNELRAGRAYFGGWREAAGAGLLAHVQLINPAGSGVQAITARIVASMAQADQLQIRVSAVALANKRQDIANALRANAAGACDIYSEANAAAQGTLVHECEVAANTQLELYPGWGPELSPGQSIILVPVTANNRLMVTFLVNEV